MPVKNIIVVDGANVAYIEKSENGGPKIDNILAVDRELKDKGYEPIIIVDASLQYEIDDAEHFETLINNQTIRQAPAGTDADFFILETAREHKAKIVTNDRYKDYQDKYNWIEKARLPLMIINGAVELYENHSPKEE